MFHWVTSHLCMYGWHQMALEGYLLKIKEEDMKFGGGHNSGEERNLRVDEDVYDFISLYISKKETLKTIFVYIYLCCIE